MYQNNEFYSECRKGIQAIRDRLEQLPAVSFNKFPRESTVLIAIDLINGFAKAGALYSPYIRAIVPKAAELAKRCGQRSIPCLAFADSHFENSPEFDAYPPHCLKGSEESELVSELKESATFRVFFKNSTNGFFSGDFQKFLHEHEEITHFILVGDCTDICVLQFAVTLKTWYQEQNKRVHVIVPADMVDTYEMEAHNRILMNHVSLFQMLQNGVEVVKTIDEVPGGSI